MAGHALRPDQRRDVAREGRLRERLDAERFAAGLHRLDDDGLLGGELLQRLGEIRLLDGPGRRLAEIGRRTFIEDLERQVVDRDGLQRGAGLVGARDQLGHVMQHRDVDPGGGGSGGERGAGILRVDEPEQHALGSELLLERLQHRPRSGEMLVVGEDEDDGLRIAFAEELVLHAAMVVEREVIEREGRRGGHPLDAVEATSLRQRRGLEPLMSGRAGDQLHQGFPGTRGVQIIGAQDDV